MAMLYDDHDLSHDFGDDEDARVERLQTIKAAVDTEIAATQTSRQDKAVAKRLQSKLKSEFALRRNVEEELGVIKAREAAALKAAQEDKHSNLAQVQQLEAKVNHSKQETTDLQAALHGLQAEIDRLHHEKQQQQPPINYVSDLNAAAAREASLLSENKSLVADIESLRRQLDWSSYCVKDLGFQVQQVESLGFKINRNIARNSYGPVAPPTSSGPPPFLNDYNGYGHQMAPCMPAAPMTGPYESVNPQVSAPYMGPYPAASHGPMTMDRSYTGHVEVAVNTPSSVGAVSLSPMHSQGHSELSPAVQSGHAEPDHLRDEEVSVQMAPPVVDGQAFLAKLQQKGERPRADESATEQASTYSAVPALLAEPSTTSLALSAPVQASRAEVADEVMPMPVEADAPASKSTGVTFAVPAAVAQKPARPFFVPAMPQEHLATLSQAARGQYHQTVTAAEKQLVTETPAPSGPYYVTPLCSPEVPRMHKNGAQQQGISAGDQNTTAAAGQDRAEQSGEGAVDQPEERKGQRRHRRHKPSNTQVNRANGQQQGGTEGSNQIGEASDARPLNNKSRAKRKKRGGRTQ